MRVIIVGAGIGGLCTAIALQQTGIEWELYERSPKLRMSGAGISFWPNATRLFRQWDILASLEAAGQPIRQTQIMTPQGETLTGLNLDRFADPAFCIQRSVLQERLVEALPSESIHLGYELTTLEQNSEQITVNFANGESCTGDLLVAADGIYSQVRSLLWPLSKPSYQGYVAWRGKVKQPLENWSAGTAMQFWGQGKRFGLLQMTSDSMYWFASLNSLNPEADMNLVHKKDYLTHLFRQWNPWVQEALSLTDEPEILVRPVEALPTLSRFTQNRVVLLGDSAHAMTPNLGQGACMAIEDAAVLARSLQGSDSLPEALASYQTGRASRVNQVRVRSQLLGKIGQWQNPLMVTLRTLGLSWAPNLITQQSFKSLFKPI